MRVCVCVCVHACVCVCVCVCTQASRSRALIFSFMDSFVFKQQVLFRVGFLSVTLDHRVQCPRVGLGGGARNQNLGHLKKSFFFFFCFYFSLM